MSYGLRYLLHRNGAIVRLPISKVIRFRDGEDGIFLQYAGEVLDLVQYQVQTEGRKVVRILRRHYVRTTVTSTGSVDPKSKMAEMRHAVESSPVCRSDAPESEDGGREAAPGPEPEWQPSPELQRRMDAVVLGLGHGRRRHKQ